MSERTMPEDEQGEDDYIATLQAQNAAMRGALEGIEAQTAHFGSEGKGAEFRPDTDPHSKWCIPCIAHQALAALDESAEPITAPEDGKERTE